MAFPCYALVLGAALQATVACADWASTTVANRSAGEELEKAVKKRLEAQSHSIENFHMEDIHSFFWWDSKVEEEQEVRATIDSEVPFAVLMEAISADHPYNLPMIVSSALPADGEASSTETPADESKYVMGTALANGTTANIAQGLAKSIVEVKYAACAQVEKHRDSDSDFYITLKTLSASKEQVVVDFGGLEFEWMPIRANKKYEEWLEDNVVIRQHEDASTSDAGNTQAESDFDFRAVVKEAFVASHGPFVTVDTRRRGDASDDWRSFLEQHSALEQVYEVGKVTFSKRASRISSVTLNVTLTNTGTTPWSSAVLRAVHGSDMGILSLPLGVVVEPGSDHKISLRLRLPQADEDAVPTSMWALSIDDRVFGPLLLLELEQEEDAALGSLLAQAQESAQKKQEASAHVFDVPQMFLQDEALREDRLKVRDVSEDWAGDLAKTGMSQAYRIGSITVTKSLSARMAPFQLLVHLTNTGLSDWPEGTGLRLVSGRSLGCELLPLEVQVSPGSKADVLMALQVSTEEDPEEMVQDTVWALADDRQFFGPLLILELSHSS